MFLDIQKQHGGLTMTAEEYIKDFTRGYSNELENGEYEYWLTPWQAEAACNLAREEVREQFEKERLKHCDELTAEQAQIESDFVVQHLKKCNRTPTFIDAIEYGRESMREKLSKLKELADKMYYAAQYLTTDASKLRKAMRDYWHYVIYELKEE